MSLLEQDELSVRTRRRFSREFKADAVALVLDGERPIAGVARDLGIGANNLGNWVRQARIDRGDKPGLTTEERVDLTRQPNWSMRYVASTATPVGLTGRRG